VAQLISGMASPGGYAGHAFLMDHCQHRFRRADPSAFIVLPAPYCGCRLARAGPGRARIAVNLREMFAAGSRFIATVIGAKGGPAGRPRTSGFCRRPPVVMFEHSVYTVAAGKPVPRICGRDASKAPAAVRRTENHQPPTCFSSGSSIWCCLNPPEATIGGGGSPPRGGVGFFFFFTFFPKAANTLRVALCWSPVDRAKALSERSC